MNNQTDLDILFERVKRLEERMDKMEFGDYQIRPQTITQSDRTSWIKNSQECLWDKLPAEDKLKPLGLSCPCPKCSPRM